jgi:hypothetical protein
MISRSLLAKNGIMKSLPPATLKIMENSSASLRISSMSKPVSKKLRAMLSLAKSAPSRIDQAKRRKTYEDKSIDLDMGKFKYY